MRHRRGVARGSTVSCVCERTRATANTYPPSARSHRKSENTTDLSRSSRAATDHLRTGYPRSYLRHLDRCERCSGRCCHYPNLRYYQRMMQGVARGDRGGKFADPGGVPAAAMAGEPKHLSVTLHACGRGWPKAAERGSASNGPAAPNPHTALRHRLRSGERTRPAISGSDPASRPPPVHTPRWIPSDPRISCSTRSHRQPPRPPPPTSPAYQHFVMMAAGLVFVPDDPPQMSGRRNNARCRQSPRATRCDTAARRRSVSEIGDNFSGVETPTASGQDAEGRRFPRAAKHVSGLCRRTTHTRSRESPWLEFPRWKYFLIAMIVLVRRPVSLHNVYPQNPAAVSSSRGGSWRALATTLRGCSTRPRSLQSSEEGDDLWAVAETGVQSLRQHRASRDR